MESITSIPSLSVRDARPVQAAFPTAAHRSMRRQLEASPAVGRLLGLFPTPDGVFVALVQTTHPHWPRFKVIVCALDLETFRTFAECGLEATAREAYSLAFETVQRGTHGGML